MNAREGKLTAEELNECFKYLKIKNKDTIKSAMVGEDCALVDFHTSILLTTDPITTDVQNIGTYLMYVATNDIYAAGGNPKFAMVTIMLPTTFAFEDTKKIFADLGFCADKLGVDIVGGHTEFTDAVNRPIVSATILGELVKQYNITDIRPGDLIYVTKDLGIEGNKILSHKDGIQSIYPDEMLSVQKESEILRKYNNVVVMHDITEGGIKGALEEILLSVNLGARIENAKMPFDILTRKLSKKHNINMNSLISSGSMLVISRNEMQDIEKEFLNNNMKITLIGKVTDGEKVNFI